MTSVSQLSEWFDRGLAEGATHMIVACDTFDWSDYPIFCKSEAACLDKYKAHNNINMQKVMEVYDLRQDKTEQMIGGRRVLRLPKINPTGEEKT